MRIKNTIRNSAVIIVSFLIMSITAFLIRKLFIIYLPFEFLGYEGLFNNVFSFLSITDFGLELIILYRLYPAFSQNNYNEIIKIISIYRFLYKLVGIIIFIFGVIFIPILPYFVKNGSVSWCYVIVIYIMQLVSVLCSYLFSYKRIIYIASQEESKCQYVDTCCFTFTSLIKIIILIYFQNYFVFLFVGISNVVISNLLISKKVDNDFPFLCKKIPVKIRHLIEMKIFTDFKHNIFQRISIAIYGATDNIVASSLIGINSVALLSNYSMVSSFFTGALVKVLHPFQASIGDLVNSRENVSHDMFLMFDRIGFLLAIVISSSFLCLLNPLISIWVGRDYLLSKEFIFCLSLNQYITWNHIFLYYYRCSFGHFDIDKNFIVLGALVNLVISIVLASSFELAGIMFGTVCGHLGFWFGRAKVVYKILFPDKVSQYIKRQFLNVIALFVSFYACSIACDSLCFYGLIEIIMKFFLCFFISSFIGIFLSIWFKEMKLFVSYIQKTYIILLQK